MKQILGILLTLGLLTRAALSAGVVVTQEDQNFLLFDGVTGSPITELVDGKRVQVKRATFEECRAAGEAELRKSTADTAKYTCTQRHLLTYTGTCDNEPTPPAEAIEGAMVTEPSDGTADPKFRIVGTLENTACLDDPTEFEISTVSYTKQSWRESSCWRKNVTPLRKCGDTVADVVTDEEWPAPEMTTAHEAGAWIASVDYPMCAPCPPEAKGHCYVPENQRGLTPEQCAAGVTP
jgi:hypothetical protein